jgi:hypothetical protein
MVGGNHLLDRLDCRFMRHRCRPKRLAAVRGDDLNNGHSNTNVRHPPNMQLGKSTIQPPPKFSGVLTDRQIKNLVGGPSDGGFFVSGLYLRVVPSGTLRRAALADVGNVRKGLTQAERTSPDPS